MDPVELEPLFNVDSFALNKSEKAKFFSARMNRLVRHHYEGCAIYRKVAEAQGYRPDKDLALADLPILPVRFFKSHDLFTLNPAEKFKQLVTSGTTGHIPGKIGLDRITAGLQSRVLAKIGSDVFGKKRRPMLVLDAPPTHSQTDPHSARHAGILGFSIFGSPVVFALTKTLELDLKAVDEFLARYGESPFFVYGFTFLAWKSLILDLESEPHTRRASMKNAVLVHGGGWKKLENVAVTAEEFNSRLKQEWGFEKIVNYYGMIEQTGSVFMQCQSGYLHASNFSDILIRNARLEVEQAGRPGLIQVASLIPWSYPGHCLLTEDVGVLHGEDDCACGRKGKYFAVHGRVANSELRGCSDTR